MKLHISEHGVYLDGRPVLATHVHLDLDTRERTAHVQLVLAVPVDDLDVDLLDARVRLVVDENNPKHVPGEPERNHHA